MQILSRIYILVLTILTILTICVFKHTVVVGDSMLNTLEDDDHLIISNFFYKPDYGDIVVFKSYTETGKFEKAIIKRVIALPGDTVEIKVSDDGRTLVVLVNGQPIEEDYAYYAPDKYPEPYGPITVGDDEIFVLGDNRYNSMDSRLIGPIKIDDIMGKVLFRFYPFNKFSFLND